MSGDDTNFMAPAKSIGQRLEPYVSFIGPTAMILAILLFMGIVEPARYFRTSNMNQILLDAALYMPMAMAMTFVITQRGIDLSIGSVAALSAIDMAFLIKQYGFPAPVAALTALALGALMGLLNGLVITRLKVPDLIGTLAMDLVYRGFALVIAKGLVLARFPDLITEIGRGQSLIFIPTSAWKSSTFHSRQPSLPVDKLNTRCRRLTLRRLIRIRISMIL